MELSHHRRLVRRQHLGDHSVDAQDTGHRFGGPTVVTGHHRDLEAEGVERQDGVGRRRADWVGDGQHGRKRPIEGGVQRRFAVLGQPRGRVLEARHVEAEGRHEAVCADLDAATFDGSADAHPRQRLEVESGRDLEVGRGLDERSADGVLARTLGGRHETQHVVSVVTGATSRSVSVGRPSVSVPVLSRATVVTSASVWSASPRRNRTPISAALPVPTITDTGVASPIAHGHAMMRTDTEATSAYVSAGLGPTASHTPNTTAAITSTAGTNTADDAVREGLDRWLRCLRLLHQCYDLSQRRVVAHTGRPRRAHCPPR